MSCTPPNAAVHLERSDPRLGVLAHLRVPLWVFDVDHGRVLWANPAGVEFWEAESVAALAARDMSDMSPMVRRRLRQLRADCVARDEACSEHWTVYPGGVPQTVEAVIAPFALADGRHALLVQVLFENREVYSETLHSTQALMHTSSMISLYDADGALLYSNPAAREAAADDHLSFETQLTDPEDLARVRRALDAHGECDTELAVRTARGVAWHAMSIRRSRNAVDGREAMLVTAVDVTARRAAERDALRLASTDTLTDLPNRSSLTRHLEERIAVTTATATASSAGFGVLFLDLDRFKLVNDSLGHGVGDALLIAVARRLEHLVREDALVARLGGDEFVIVAGESDGANGSAAHRALAERVLETMAAPFRIGAHRLHMQPSIGIVRFPEHGPGALDLLRHADVAMYAAKSARSGHRLFDQAMSRDLESRLALEHDLGLALRRGEIETHFQPRVSACDERVVAFEALARWRHPTRGLLGPAVFIGLAEESGLIVELGATVLRQALRQQRLWCENGHAVRVSINVSAQQFASGDLHETVRDALAESACDPRDVELEITESVLDGEASETVSTLGRISALGVRVAIDDFGTGYSNLARLGRYRLDCLKIDRAFVAESENRALLESILRMGQALGLTVVAEGVESEAQARWLSERGCDELQGYLYGRPTDATAASALLRAGGGPSASGERERGQVVALRELG